MVTFSEGVGFGAGGAVPERSGSVACWAGLEATAQRPQAMVAKMRRWLRENIGNAMVNGDAAR